MEKQEYHITIDAPKEKVWKALWDIDNYRAWTSAFAEGSTVKTDNWQKGSKVFFLNAKGDGMVARIEENIPNRVMSFMHLGEVKDGVEDTTSEKVKQWAGAIENYRLNENGGKTELVVNMDLNEEYAAMFSEIWPKALNNIKELAEKN